MVNPLCSMVRELGADHQDLNAARVSCSFQRTSELDQPHTRTNQTKPAESCTCRIFSCVFRTTQYVSSNLEEETRMQPAPVAG